MSFSLKSKGSGPRGRFAGISFGVRRGEVVALAGLVGAGRTEVARSIFGVDRYDTGVVKLNGTAVRFRTPREALAAGLAYLPENRQHEGLILPFSVAGNVSLPVLRELSKAGWLCAARSRRSPGSRWRSWVSAPRGR